MEFHHSGILLCKTEYAVMDEMISVGLYAYRAGVSFEYELQARQGSECISCRIGQDLEMARELLFRLAKSGVTACQFCDVVGDDLFAVL